MRYLGDYRLPDGSTLVGELVLNGPRTTLSVHSSDDIAPLDSHTTVTGVAYTGEYLTLINCNSPAATITHNHGGNDRYRSSIFPHHVTVGRTHLNSQAAAINRIEFGTTDLNALFYDFDAFGTVIDSRSIIDAVLAERRKLRAVESGEEPLVAYFSGKNQIISLPTVIGTVSAEHRLNYSLGGPTGVNIKNHMAVCIVPTEPVTLEDALRRIYDLVTFLSVSAGRVQGIHRVRLCTQDPSSKKAEFFEVHSSFQWRMHGKSKRFKPHPGDVPLSPIERPAEFRKVLSNWLERHNKWRLARIRYHECIKKTNHYGPDRLVAAANMFDLLPKDAVPAETAPSTDLAAARANGVALFKDLPDSIDKNMMMGAFGRIGQPSLPKKVKHRAAVVEVRVGKAFPELQWVVSIAVKCRNVFVHGDKGDLDLGKVEAFVPFLTDTLEFVFAASDFIELGWDTEIWLKNPYSWGHTFTRFRDDYMATLPELKKALTKNP
jgi:hypothetical protein